MWEGRYIRYVNKRGTNPQILQINYGLQSLKVASVGSVGSGRCWFVYDWGVIGFCPPGPSPPGWWVSVGGLSTAAHRPEGTPPSEGGVPRARWAEPNFPRVSNSPSDHWYSSNYNDYSRNGLLSACQAAKWSFLMIGWIIMKLTNSSFFQVLKSVMATICTNTRNPSEKNPVCAMGSEVCDTNTNTITNKDENIITIQEIQERKSLCVLWEAKSVMASSKYKYKHR